ncbi:MAG: hypothetical protein KAX45_08975 [Chitinophagaceae bacterium]|nr:hypothetical protein [Chitinophagaceae bacterium]
MFEDLIVHITEGGYMPVIDEDGDYVFKGIYPPYLQFTSESLQLKSRPRSIEEGSCSGYVSKNMQKLFYFEYREEGNQCRVYPVINGVRSDQFIEPPSTLTLVD